MSAEQDSLIDNFLDTFYITKDPEAKSACIKEFLRENPDLAAILANETEALITLKDPFIQQGLYTEYVDTLLWLRENFPQAYVHVFGYLDFDLIAYLSFAGRTTEIDDYLDLFRKYPTHDPDSLDELLNFLMCQGLFDMAYNLALDVYKALYADPDIIIWEGLLQILTMGCFAPYLEAAAQGPITEKMTRDFLQCIKPYRDYLPEKWFKRGYHDHLVHMYFKKPYSPCTLNGTLIREDILERYNEMLIAFMGFLHRERGLHWPVADYFRSLLSDFFCELVQKGKIPKVDFPLTKNQIRKTLIKSKRNILGHNSNVFLSTLSALYVLAEYLLLTGSITKELTEEIQACCQEIHTEAFSQKDFNDPEALTLKRFPLI